MFIFLIYTYPSNNCGPPPSKVARQQCTVNGRAFGSKINIYYKYIAEKESKDYETHQSELQTLYKGRKYIFLTLLFHSDGLNIPLIANVIPMRVLSTTEDISFVSDIFRGMIKPTYPSSDTSSVRIEMSGT